MTRNRIIFLISTGLLSVLMVMSAGMYIFDNATVTETFGKLGYPGYIVYPLAIVKLLGVATLWLRPSKLLLGLAYAGFFYDFVLAFFAHVMAGDGAFAPAFVAILLVAASYFTRPDAEAAVDAP